MYIVGGLNDQTALLVWGEISKNLFRISSPSISNFTVYQNIFKGLINPLSTNQPITWFFASIFLSLFGIESFNILLLITIFLNFLLSFTLFKRFKFPLFYSLIFTFSSFTWIHLGKHLEVLQLWVLPLFINALLNRKNSLFNFKTSLKLGFFMSVATMVFNYFGFFLMIFFTIYTAYSLCDSYIKNRAFNFNFLRTYLSTSITALLVSFVILFPYFRANYFPTLADLQEVNGARLSRPIEDFFTFSSRPWYYLIPSPNSPIFGRFSTGILKRIKSTNYFLSDDYFIGESPASFFGYAFLLVTFSIYIYSFIKNIHIKNSENLNYMNLFAFLSFILLLFTLPPFFTIASFKIFTPGYLVFRFFHMFRVTSRLSILILLCLLLTLGYGLESIYSTKRDSYYKRVKIFLTILLFITLSETFVNVKVYQQPNPSKAYKYLNLYTQERTKFAVYPYNSTKSAFFFINTHLRYLINPVGYTSYGYDSKIFTESLASNSGIAQLIGLDAKYLIVFKIAEPDQVQFFLANKSLYIEKEFNDSYLFGVKK